jgi:hypothetical protein
MILATLPLCERLGIKKKKKKEEKEKKKSGN